MTFFQRIQATGVPSHLAAEGAVRTRLRPVFMTSLVATLGLLPTAISHGIGSQTQKPLAIVVIGGALCLLVASRVMQPALLTLLHRKRTKKPDAAATTEVAPTLVADALGE